MSNFAYARPASLAEAFSLSAGAQGGAVYLAGGTDLLLKCRKGALKPALVISLTGLPGLRFIAEEEAVVRVGGLTSLRDLERSAVIGRACPALADAVRNMASVQIRNVATLAGNVVNAAPSADTAPPLLALGAEALLAGPGGTRRVALAGFFTGPGRTALAPGEILTEFVIPKPAGLAGGAYAKVARRRAMDLALLGVAIQLELEADGRTCAAARIGLGVAGPTPRRAPEAESYLAGRAVDQESLTKAGQLAAAESACRDSLRGEAWYRREMIRVQVKRLGLLALERARGGGR